MDALSEKDTRRPVELGYDYTFRPVDDEQSTLRHIGDGPQIHVLDDGIKIFVLRIRTIQFEFGFKGNTIGQTTFNTLINRIPGRVNLVVQEFQNEIITCVCDGKIVTENPVQAFYFSVLRCGFHLEKLSERL